MIKDADQKQRAVSYCVANGIVPFLEVLVQNSTDTNDTKTDLTDLDVLGIQVSGCDRPHRILFDCKTQKGVSPINRAFWASGAMAYTGCQEAFIILKKSAPEGHRFAAKHLGVHLFDDALFEHYATATSPDYVQNPSYLCRVGVWDRWTDLRNGWPRLESLLRYMDHTVPLESNHVRALRTLVGQLSRSAGEFDPARPAHVAIFYNYLACFAMCMTQIVGDLRNVFDPKMDFAAFDKLCTRYVWEGKDNYDVRNRLHRLTQSRHSERPLSEITDLQLPGWIPFLELTRAFLEAPTCISTCPLPLRELAFRALTNADELGDAKLQDRLTQNKRTLQFCLSLSSYAVKAANLPREFGQIATAELTKLHTHSFNIDTTNSTTRPESL